jgi:uncharacterized Zn-finger protein
MITMIRPKPMSQCPYCGKVYDESDDPVCPYCDGFYGRRKIRHWTRCRI